MNFFTDENESDILANYGTTTGVVGGSSNNAPNKESLYVEGKELRNVTPVRDFKSFRESDGIRSGNYRPKASLDSPRTIFSPSANFSPAPLSESRNYCNRLKVGESIFRYNCKDDSSWDESKISSDVKWTIITNPYGGQELKSNAKFMFQRTREMALVLTDHVSELGSLILQQYSLGAAQNLMDSTTEDEVYIGRIRCDGKLTANSIMLEGTLESSNGHILSLDMSQVEEYFLFPGQVLSVVGKNDMGRCLRASRLFIPQPLPFREDLIKISKTSGPLSVIIASGPFTPSDSLAFEPLKDLVKVIKENKPHVCFLVGPFLDASHPLLNDEATELDYTFEELFQNNLKELSEALDGVNTKIVLISSYLDVHHSNVYPTPPYNTSKFPNIISAPDPSIISVGGILFGLTSADILMHLSKTELANATISSDRMGRISRHLLSQHSFYPLYPPDESVPLDVELWANFGQMKSTPHVLVLPSTLRFFIKDIDGTVVVNPEHLTKGHSGGTYAKLLFDLPNENESFISAPIADYVQGEIVKI